MRTFISSILILATLATAANSATPTKRDCCCPPCKQPARTTTYRRPAPSKLVLPVAPAKRDTVVVHSLTTNERVIHYKPEPSAVREARCMSKWWIAGAALAAGTAGYFIGRNNGSDETFITTTVITPPPCDDDDCDDDDKKGKGKR